MRRENVLEAPAAYAASPIVRAVSVLTNTSHFGMSVERLSATREIVRKPVLRKDFIFDDYQVYEARAFGADAILLMANLLEPGEMQGLFLLARELGMEPLFECHDREQIEQVPTGAKVFGVNSRSFAVGTADYERARAERASGAHKDSTTDLSRFELGRYLPAGAIKVAESGVHPHTIARIRDELGYHAALVGTSLLMAAHGIHRELLEFEQALRMSPKPSRSKIRS
jgi:indole-3-glycerol phosphate synthase